MSRPSVDLPGNATSIIDRLDRLFPRHQIASITKSGHDFFSDRLTFHIGDLDIVYEPLAMDTALFTAKSVRIMVWRRCDAFLSVEACLGSDKILNVEVWQSEKVDSILVPLLDQALVLDDLSQA
ncbi:MAG: hypothetical protein AB7L09_02435 [Nitrospira sp.]